MFDLVRTVVAFSVVIGLLVFVHEGGHYLAARWRGVTVEVFSIGFGRELVGWTDRVGTRWRIAALPLGGYVRMLGQSDFGLDDAAEAARASQPGSFAGKSVLSRAIVVAAGPVFNLLFATVVFAGVFMTFGQPVDRPVVAAVLPGTPAAAGLRPGDTILSIDGVAMPHVADVPRAVSREGGHPITVLVRRGGATLPVRVTPRLVERGGREAGQLGIEVGASAALERLSPPRAVLAGVRDTGRVVAGIAGGIWQIATGGGGARELGGPLRIAQVSGEAAQAGPGSFLLLIAMISVNLAFVNLLPVPVLDGGYLAFFLVEAVTGRPLSRRAQLAGLQAGLALIGTLFLFVTVNDLGSFGLFHWVRSLAG